MKTVALLVTLMYVVTTFGVHLKTKNGRSKISTKLPKNNLKIVGGKPTTIEAIPFQLSLLVDGRHNCGASIISADRALTAAHCTKGEKASSLSVRVGSNYTDKGGQVIQVASICQHPDYDEESTDKDVSVLRLASKIVFDHTKQPIGLGVAPPAGCFATVTGWGVLFPGGPAPSVLHEVKVPRVGQAECKKIYDGLTDNMVCFGYTEGGKDSCYGDSGGPLVANGKQVGIVSFGAGCAEPDAPGVYSDVSAEAMIQHIESC